MYTENCLLKWLLFIHQSHCKSRVILVHFERIRNLLRRLIRSECLIEFIRVQAMQILSYNSGNGKWVKKQIGNNVFDVEDTARCFSWIIILVLVQPTKIIIDAYQFKCFRLKRQVHLFLLKLEISRSCAPWMGNISINNTSGYELQIQWKSQIAIDEPNTNITFHT